MDPGHLRATGITLRALILRAFAIEDFQLQGGPGWVGTTRFSVEATTEAPANSDQMMAMLQGALTERFSLQLDRRERTQSVLALVVDPKGSKLTELRTGDNGTTPVARDSPNQMTIQVAQTMPQLVNWLNRLSGPGQLPRHVVDRTGLDGRYNVWLTLQNESIPGSAGGRLFTEDVPRLLQQQLGLRLVPQAAPVTYFTIRSVALPTVN